VMQARNRGDDRRRDSYRDREEGIGVPGVEE
jgi:hypothetical protein